MPAHNGLPWLARIGRGLRDIVRVLTKHTDVHAVHKSKDFETTSMHNKNIHLLSIIYSLTFLPNVALSHHFHYSYGSYDIETSFICANMYILSLI